MTVDVAWDTLEVATSVLLAAAWKRGVVVLRLEADRMTGELVLALADPNTHSPDADAPSRQ